MELTTWPLGPSRQERRPILLLMLKIRGSKESSKRANWKAILLFLKMWIPNHLKSPSFLSNLIIVSAELNLHISTGSCPTASHMLSTSLPNPHFFAVSMLRGSMNGARHCQAALMIISCQHLSYEKKSRVLWSRSLPRRVSQHR